MSADDAAGGWVERAGALHDEFVIVVANTAELRDASFALRHDVYCRELGYEPVTVDGRERDAHDARARHYLLAHVPTGTWAGCVRLVLAAGSGATPGLPFETAGVPLLDAVRAHVAATPDAAIGEISRLTVAAPFRRRDGQWPTAMLCLTLAVVAAAARCELDYALCVTTPRLADEVRTYGIRLAQLSAPFDYHGPRALYCVAPAPACRDVRPELRTVLSSIQSRIGW
ncbi:MAG TPA: GNAT family N-acyltransferase [Candidatus Dormibacteraeota bacterium]